MIFEWEKLLGDLMREVLMPEWNSGHSVDWRAELARPVWNWAVMVHGTGRVSRERRSCAKIEETSDGDHGRTLTTKISSSSESSSELRVDVACLRSVASSVRVSDLRTS